MQSIVFEGKAFEQFTNWAKADKKIHLKIVELINNIQSTPFIGLGKPEPLKYQLQGYWSRRITDEHRLVYKVTDTSIVIISCKYHYE